MSRFLLMGLAVMLSLSGVFFVSCSNQNSPTGTGNPTPTGTPAMTSTPTVTATPTVTSTPASQLFVLVAHFSGSGTTIVGIQGPFSNGASSNFSFALPPIPTPDVYFVDGLLDLSNSFAVPSGAQSINLPTGGYDQFAPTGNPCFGVPSAAYTSTTTGINCVMSTANGACSIVAPAPNYYSPESGTAITLSGSISQSGL